MEMRHDHELVTAFSTLFCSLRFGWQGLLTVSSTLARAMAGSANEK
jgi:hypothetical protein